MVFSVYCFCRSCVDVPVQLVSYFVAQLASGSVFLINPVPGASITNISRCIAFWGADRQHDLSSYENAGLCRHVCIVAYSNICNLLSFHPIDLPGPYYLRLGMSSLPRGHRCMETLASLPIIDGSAPPLPSRLKVWESGQLFLSVSARWQHRWPLRPPLGVRCPAKTISPPSHFTVCICAE